MFLSIYSICQRQQKHLQQPKFASAAINSFLQTPWTTESTQSNSVKLFADIEVRTFKKKITRRHLASLNSKDKVPKVVLDCTLKDYDQGCMRINPYIHSFRRD